MKHLVITVHGIRTFGDWQERLERLLNKETKGESLTVLNYKYGYFSVIAFLIPPIRWLVVRRFRLAFLEIAKSSQWDRIDLVAHSFGTHLVGWGLHGIPKNARPRVHTIILSGSVLKPSFPWLDLTDSCLHRLVNDCGTYDQVLVLNELIVLFTGMAGRVGFAGMTGNNFRNRFFPFGHSGYFLGSAGPDDSFMTAKWVPLIVQDSPIALFPDPRSSSAVGGLIAFFLNNVEPIKLVAYSILLATPALVYYRLYKDAERQRLASISRELAAYSRAQLGDDPELSLLLAMHSVSKTWQANRTVVPEAEDVLHSAILASNARLTLGPFGGSVSSVAWSPDGLRLASASVDGAVRVWNAGSGDELLTLPTRKSAVYWVAWSPDGERLATGGQSGQVDVWQTTSGQLLFSMDLPNHAWLGAGSWRSSGEQLVTAGSDGIVRLWNMQTRTQLKAFHLHTDAVSGIAWDSEGKRLASVSYEGAAAVWNPDSPGAPLRLRAGLQPGGVVSGVSWNSDGRRIATANNGFVTIWDALSGEPLRNININGFGVAWAPIGSSLAIAGSNWKAIVVDTTSGETVKTFSGHKGYVTCVSWSPDGKRLASGSYDGTVKIWTLNGDELPTMRVEGQPRKAAWNPNRNELAAIYGDNVKIWNAENGKGLRDLKNPDNELLVDIAWNHNGSWLAVGSDGGTTVIWDVVAGGVRSIPSDPPAFITGLAWRPDGRVLALARSEIKWEPQSGGHNVQLVDLEARGREWIKLPVMGGAADHIAWNANGAWLAAGTAGGSVTIWNATTGTELRTLIRDQDSVKGISWSPDGKRIATTTVNLEPSIWDVETGTKVVTLYDHRTAINGITWSADGLRLATANDDGSVGIWDASNGSELFRLYGQAGRVIGVAWSADSRRLATWGQDGLIRQYAMNVELIMSVARSRTTRDLTVEECKKYLHVSRCPPRP